MKTKFVVNPEAAKGKAAKKWPGILEQLVDHIGDYDSEYTQGPNSATKIANKAVHEGFNRIVAVGGDGTINETVNGLFEGDRPVNQDAAFSFVEIGTAGDFGRSFYSNKGNDPVTRFLSAQTIRKIDIGKVFFVGHDGSPRTRYFCNIASFGMGGEVDRRMNESKVLKKLGGTPAFLLSTYMTLLYYKNKQIKLTIDDRHTEDVIIRNVAIANGRYFGGAMKIAPQARLEDGTFDIIIIGDLGRFKVMINTPKIYKGTHLSVPGVSFIQGKKVVVESEEEVLLDIDGEAPGRLPATFEVIPASLTLQI